MTRSKETNECPWKWIVVENAPNKSEETFYFLMSNEEKKEGLMLHENYRTFIQFDDATAKLLHPFVPLELTFETAASQSSSLKFPSLKILRKGKKTLKSVMETTFFNHLHSALKRCR